MAKFRRKERKEEKEARKQLKQNKEKPRITNKFVPISARTPNQKEALRALSNSVITILIGTAGTGKTLLAISHALQALDTGCAQRLVLIRPLVAVGESLGYLPGDVVEKITPYSTPLLYYIDDLTQSKGYSATMIKDGRCEVVPLALIRGRTFKDSIIILDEAQNVTKEQMQAVLTRLGEGSQLVIVGDQAQVDLSDPGDSGLDDLLHRVFRSNVVGTTNLDYGPRADVGVRLIELVKEDIQRNAILKEIYDWYNR